MSNFEDIKTNLRAELISLRSQWLATRQTWRDPVGDRFEKDFWHPIEEQASCYLRALEKLSELLKQSDLETR